jgi:NADPH-ferrihemoprotein reductase
LDDYDHQHLSAIPPQALVAFVLATYGEGDPPDNAQDFLTHLYTCRVQGQRLDNLRYIVFGLGNTNYQYYNKVAKDVDHLLSTLGATRVGALGLGNDCKGTTEEEFIAWKESIDHALVQVLGVQSTARSYNPQIQVQTVQDVPDMSIVYQGEPHASFLWSPLGTAQSGSAAPVILPVTHARELSRQGNRTCVHLEFGLDQRPGIRYETGDYLRIWPINPEAEVEQLLSLLGLWEQRQNVISITSLANVVQTKIRVPTPTTVEALFRFYLDICGPVSRDFLSGFTNFLTDSKSKQRLEGVTDDGAVFRRDVTEKRLTLSKVLQSLVPQQSLLPVPLSYLLENMKRLQPRSYSISSSSLVEPNRITVTAQVLSDESPEELLTGVFKGVTTHYLLQLRKEWCRKAGHCEELAQLPYATIGPRGMLQGVQAFCQVRRSQFKLPVNPIVPIIMIGTGTGVAPFRAFVQERVLLKLQGVALGKAILFVGHRRADEDFYYHDEWSKAQTLLGESFQLHTAFSRCEPREYVQDVLKKNIDVVLDVLTKDPHGVAYVCGSSAMANGVKACLKEGWAQNQLERLDAVVADNWFSELKRTKRVMEDSWG